MTIENQMEDIDVQSDLDLSSLSKREIEIVGLLSHGMSRSAIANSLFRSRKTVDNHCTRIYHKLGVRSQAELVSLILRGPGAMPVMEISSAGIRRRQSMGERVYDALVPLESRLADCASELFFDVLIAGLAEAVGTELAGITEFDTAGGNSVVLAGVDRGVPTERTISPLATSACGRVLQLGEFACERDAPSVLPDAEMIRAESIESYAGVRLDARSVGTVGCIWVADRKPMRDMTFVQHMLRLLRRRISSEVALQAVLDHESE